MAEEEEEATNSPLPPMEFASSLKVLGWFVQMLFDKSLTATLQHWGVITDKPDLSEALQSLLDELNSVQAMLSLAQNFWSQNMDLLKFLKNLMDAAYEADDLLSELDYYRLEQQEVNNSEDEDLLGKVDYRLQKQQQLRTIDHSMLETSISFHHINKDDIVPRIHQIVSGLEDLVTCLSEALSLLQPEEGLRANPNVFPVASHPLTKSFLLSNHGNHLEDLPESEFLSMFNKCAFGGEDPSDHLELAEIAKQIAGKLDGSSLAARTVGGLLRDNLDEQHWRSVLCSDIWQQQRSPDDIMPILRFSYHHLPAHLQQCFAYCGVFPENWELEKEKLVGMWISQGYIHTKSEGNMSPEEVGSEYFDSLVSRSFIQASSNQYTSKTYVLHQLLHDLAKSVSEDECLIVNLRTEKITSRVRHIYAHADNLCLLKRCNLRKLRTLIIHGSIRRDDINVLKEVLNGLKSIRVLSLKNVSVQLMWGSVGHLIHLRYLTVRGSYQDTPPDYQCKPYHLQWLIFEADSTGPFHLVLPAAKHCLVSLRHFLSPLRGPFEKTGIEEVSGIGIGIGKLTHLQELESFRIGYEEGHQLGELKRLNELRGTLRLISIENASPQQAIEANLNKKIGIRELTLSCSGEHPSPQMAEKVYEGLRPPPYIKKLNLNGYNGVKSPSWMVTENHCLSYLQSLSLRNCLYWKVLPTLGELPLLKYLAIYGAHSVEEIGNSFYGSGVAKTFPCLDTLQFTGMRELVVWSGRVVSSGGKDMCPVFPRLRYLMVNDCPKLKQVPIQYMTSVEELLIFDCPNLPSLPIMPASLQHLSIKYCRKLPRERYREGGDDWHKISHVPTVDWR